MVTDHTGRPRLTSKRRRTWKQFLLSEWGLLLLAAALTYIIWDNVRDRVIKDHTIKNIMVELKVVPNGVDAVLVDGGTVDIKVECSERERDEIVAQLRRDGEGELRVTMLIRDVPAQNERPLRATRDRFQWKFAEERLLREVSPAQPTGTVFRTKKQTLTVARPATDLDGEEGTEIDIQLSRDTVNLDLPLATAEDREVLAPDSLALADFILKPEFEFDQAYVFTLSFDGWRSAKAGWRSVYRDGLGIEPVQATVTVRQTGAVSITNTLLVQLDANNYEYQFDENHIQARLVGGGRWLFTGALQGRKTVLKELAESAQKNEGSWVWGIRVSGALPTKPPDGKDPEWVDLNGEIVWIPYNDKYRDRGITFTPMGVQRGFDIKVRWHPAHK